MPIAIVSPSLLSADFKNLQSEINRVEKAGAKWLHFDVMDGHFVPNISLGIPVIKSVCKCHNMVNDVHIMISEPKKYAKKFVEAGADYLTFHYEACESDKEVFEVIDIIHAAGAKAGLSIKPGTPIEKVYPFLYSLDLVLIMSVEPGFGGQEFMPCSLSKTLLLRNYIDTNKINCLIEIDGGINAETAKNSKLAGVDIFVAGSYLFGHDDLEERMKTLLI